MNSLLIQENIVLQNFTTFKVGGPARYFAEAQSLADIQEVQYFAQQKHLPLFVLGKGSNLVVADQGFAGVVLHLGKKFSNITIQDQQMTVEAGALLNSVVTQANRAGLAGIECLGGIPGTVGAGAWINAGAYGQELGDKILSVEVLMPQGNLQVFSHEQCQFAYRHSQLMQTQGIVVRVHLGLDKGDPAQLQATLQECLIKRKDKQPLELPNAGSMFKRPPGKFAGALIEASGLKGYRVGDAQVSEKHAGFVVNVGHATAQDIWQLTQDVIEKVKLDHGITLEREVVFLGVFGE